MYITIDNLFYSDTDCNCGNRGVETEGGGAMKEFLMDDWWVNSDIYGQTHDRLSPVKMGYKMNGTFDNIITGQLTTNGSYVLPFSAYSGFRKYLTFIHFGSRMLKCFIYLLLLLYIYFFFKSTVYTLYPIMTKNRFVITWQIY